MKIVCVNNIGYESELTIGKTYDLILRITAHQSSSRRFSPYKVLNDLGQVYSFNEERFITLEEWRESQLNKIL